VCSSDLFIDEEAELIFPALLAALGLERVSLFGHSVGGGMAIAIAARHAAHCAAVVTVSAQAAVEARTLEGIRTAKASFADPAQFARLTRLHGERARWVLDAWTETWLAPAFADWTLDAALAAVRCPVLALHGENDEFGSVAFPQRIAAGVPTGRGRAVILEGIGHMPHREDPTKVLDLVAAFLAAGPTRSPAS
jgi:pimeloyl-ACP methyl ester carboxylesterase